MLALASATAMAAARPDMRALVWIARGHEFDALAYQPATCPDAAAGDARLAAGRALFNAPGLLGGQAARAQISCASCHANGRTNAHFFLEGVSSAPGTADVSSSFFSIARANARFDPRPIPDLTMPGKIPRDPASGKLEHFLRGLIVEEFAGHEPSPQTLATLAAYVRSLRPCADRASEARRLQGQLDLVRDSVEGARWMAERHEIAAAVVLTSAARHQLGLIDERFAQPGLAGERRMLLLASRELQPIAEAQAPDPRRLSEWLDRFETRIAPRLMRAEPRSLYQPDRLAKWLAVSR